MEKKAFLNELTFFFLLGQRPSGRACLFKIADGASQALLMWAILHFSFNNYWSSIISQNSDVEHVICLLITFVVRLHALQKFPFFFFVCVCLWYQNIFQDPFFLSWQTEM